MLLRRCLLLLFTMVLLCGLTVPAHATLLNRGGGLIYDDDLDITWLQDANYAGTAMNWDTAMAWADGLSYYDSVRDVTYDDWRLPTTPGTAAGSVNEGEMGHLYYDEGVTYATPSLFTNVQSNYYWSDTEWALNSNFAWNFKFDGGFQDYYNKVDYDFYAWAVRPGDFAAIPEPTSLLLLGSGLIGLIGLRRKLR